MIRLRCGDCGLLNMRNGIPFALLNMGTWRRPLRFANGRLSTALLFGCGHRRGGGRGSLDPLPQLVCSGVLLEVSINVDDTRGFGVAMKSKICLSLSGYWSKPLKILSVLGAP